MKLQLLVLCFLVAINFECIAAAALSHGSYGYGYNPREQNPYDIYRLIQSYFSQPSETPNSYYNPYVSPSYFNYGPYNPYPISKAAMPSFDYQPYLGSSAYSKQSPTSNFDDQYNPNYRSLETEVQTGGQVSAASKDTESSAVEPPSSSSANKN